MENGTSPRQHWFDRELAWVVSIFALLWIGIGSAAYYYSPVVACLNFKLNDPAATCRQALELSYLPMSTKSRLRIKLVETHIELSENDEALTVIAHEEEAAGTTVWLLEKKADLLQRESRQDKAAAAYREILKLEPTNQSAASDLTRIEVDTNHLNMARKTAATFVETSPNSAVMISWQGWVEHRAGDNTKAMAFYDRAIALTPEEAYLHRDVSDIKIAMNDRTGAVEAMTMAIKIAPEETSYFEKRAEIYETIGEIQLSQADYEESLSINRNATTLVTLGRSYTDSRDFEKARLLFDEAISQNYEVIWVYDSKIRMYVRQGSFPEARKAIAELLKIDPESIDAKYWNASMSYEEGRYEDALREFEDILRLAPNYTDAMIEAGHALIELKRSKESLPYFTEAIANRPSSEYAYASRARAHFQMENWWATVSDANQSIKLRPAQIGVYARRGLAWAKLGKLEEAKASLDEAAKNAPTLEWIQRDNLEFLITHNFLAEAQAALLDLKKVAPDSKLVPEFETLLRMRGMKVP
jgi:tetratricopeptide (TPR) repeat protein